MRSRVRLRGPFSTMMSRHEACPVARSRPRRGRACLSCGGIIKAILSHRLCRTFSMLSCILIDTPKTPMHRTLVSTKVKRSICKSFRSNVLRPVFSVITGGTSRSSRAHFIRVVRRALRGLMGRNLGRSSLLTKVGDTRFQFQRTSCKRFPGKLLCKLRYVRD